MPDDAPGTVYGVVATGVAAQGELIREYQALVLQIAWGGDERLLGRLDRLPHQMEVSGAWSLFQRVEAVMTRSALDGAAIWSVQRA